MSLLAVSSERGSIVSPADKTFIEVCGLQVYQGNQEGATSAMRTAFLTLSAVGAVAMAVVATSLAGSALLLSGAAMTSAVVAGVIVYNVKELGGASTAAAFLGIQAAAGAYVVMALGSCPLGVVLLAGGILGGGLGLGSEKHVERHESFFKPLFTAQMIPFFLLGALLAGATRSFSKND